MISITRRVELKGIGEGWDDRCYLLIKPLVGESWKNVREIIFKFKDQPELIEQSQKIRDILCSLFVSGKGLDKDGNVIDITHKMVVDFYELLAPKIMENAIDKRATDENFTKK